MEKLKWARDLIKTRDSSVSCGFNMFIMGDRSPNFQDYPNDAFERLQGYKKANEMANDGKIYYTHRFKCSCGGDPFYFGGFIVCNSCGGKGVNKDWWIIKVEKDGNGYCCHGLNFEDIQDSSNYAFGKTRQEAIDNYEKLRNKKMTSIIQLLALLTLHTQRELACQLEIDETLLSKILNCKRSVPPRLEVKIEEAFYEKRCDFLSIPCLIKFTELYNTYVAKRDQSKTINLEVLT